MCAILGHTETVRQIFFSQRVPGMLQAVVIV
jgi:hypothetical protein